jgi:hypothetical protein
LKSFRRAGFLHKINIRDCIPLWRHVAAQKNDAG